MLVERLFGILNYIPNDEKFEMQQLDCFSTCKSSKKILFLASPLPWAVLLIDTKISFHLKKRLKILLTFENKGIWSWGETFELILSANYALQYVQKQSKRAPCVT